MKAPSAIFMNLITPSAIAQVQHFNSAVLNAPSPNYSVKALVPLISALLISTASYP